MFLHLKGELQPVVQIENLDLNQISESKSVELKPSRVDLKEKQFNCEAVEPSSVNRSEEPNISPVVSTTVFQESDSDEEMPSSGTTSENKRKAVFSYDTNEVATDHEAVASDDDFDDDIERNSSQELRDSIARRNVASTSHAQMMRSSDTSSDSSQSVSEKENDSDNREDILPNKKATKGNTSIKSWSADSRQRVKPNRSQRQGKSSKVKDYESSENDDDDDDEEKESEYVHSSANETDDDDDDDDRADANYGSNRSSKSKNTPTHKKYISEKEKGPYSSKIKLKDFIKKNNPSKKRHPRITTSKQKAKRHETESSEDEQIERGSRVENDSSSDSNTRQRYAGSLKKHRRLSKHYKKSRKQTSDCEVSENESSETGRTMHKRQMQASRTKNLKRKSVDLDRHKRTFQREKVMRKSNYKSHYSHSDDQDHSDPSYSGSRNQDHSGPLRRGFSGVSSDVHSRQATPEFASKKTHLHSNNIFHHRKQSLDRSYHSPARNEQVLQYKCSECPNVYSDALVFAEHMNQHKRMIKPVYDKNVDYVEELQLPEKQYECYICSMLFRYRDSFDKHLKSHNTPLQTNNFDMQGKVHSSGPNISASRVDHLAGNIGPSRGHHPGSNIGTPGAYHSVGNISGSSAVNHSIGNIHPSKSDYFIVDLRDFSADTCEVLRLQWPKDVYPRRIVFENSRQSNSQTYVLQKSAASNPTKAEPAKVHIEQSNRNREMKPAQSSVTQEESQKALHSCDTTVKDNGNSNTSGPKEVGGKPSDGNEVKPSDGNEVKRPKFRKDLVFCPICPDTSFRAVKTLREHFVNAHEEDSLEKIADPYHCRQCEERFPNKPDREAHIMAVHPKSLKKKLLKASTNQKPIPTLKCRFCENVYKNKKSFVKHEQICPNNKSSSNLESQMPSTSYGSREQAGTHEMYPTMSSIPYFPGGKGIQSPGIHEGLQSAAKSNDSLSRDGSQTERSSTSDNSTGPYQCIACKMRFFTERGMRIHFARVHINDTP